MTGQNQGKSAEFTFQNYQRILNHHSSASLSIIKFVITLISAGLIGAYKLIGHDKWEWLFIESVVMFLSLLSLFVIWYREHNLGVSAIKYLRDEFHKDYGEENLIKFPVEDKMWIGKTAFVVISIFVINLVIWLIVILISMGHIFQLYNVCNICLCLI